jgi:hypothetical protein
MVKPLAQLRVLRHQGEIGRCLEVLELRLDPLEPGADVGGDLAPVAPTLLPSRRPAREVMSGVPPVARRRELTDVR